MDGQTLKKGNNMKTKCDRCSSTDNLTELFLCGNWSVATLCENCWKKLKIELKKIEEGK